jgi:DNA-binding winged helix-turn-helix (wHTH) protein
MKEIEETKLSIRDKLQQETLFNRDTGLLIINSLPDCIGKVKPINYLLPIAKESIDGKMRRISFHAQTGECYVNEKKGVGKLRLGELVMFLGIYSSSKGVGAEELIDWYNEVFIGKREMSSRIHCMTLVGNIRKVIGLNVNSLDKHEILRTKLYGDENIYRFTFPSMNLEAEDLLSFSRRSCRDLVFSVRSGLGQDQKQVERLEYFLLENDDLFNMYDSIKGFLSDEKTDSSRITLFVRKGVLIQIDTESRKVLFNGELVHHPESNEIITLDPLEMKILSFLLAALGKSMMRVDIKRRIEESQGKLLNEVIKKSTVVTAYVNLIRKKLNYVFTGLESIIETVGRAYRFNIEGSGLLGDEWI